MKRYEVLANEFSEAIRNGIWRAGDRLPSVRSLARERGVSPTTIFSAYYLLESWGLVRAQDRSGYYVVGHPVVRPPEFDGTQAEVAGQVVQAKVIDRVFDLLSAMLRRDVVPLGAAFPSARLFPLERLGQLVGKAARNVDPWSTVDNLSMGDLRLRRNIARRYAATGKAVHADEVIITNGAMEALNLCLMSVARPGDAVAVESPAFYGVFQALERLGLRAIEIPTHPEHGMDLQVLEQVFAEQRPAACWVMSHFQNPLGSLMPEAKKKAMADLAAKYRIPLIEDDVYGELHFSNEALQPIKTYDRDGWVLHCSSFSKTLAPHYRVGWAIPGRFIDRMARQKLTFSLAASMPAQVALAAYLEQGSYDKQLRLLRRTLQASQGEMLHAIADSFPAETRCTRPEGGYFLWLELPQDVDAMALFQTALEGGVSLAPGTMFTAKDGAYGHCVRLNYGLEWNDAVARAVQWLGRSVRAVVPLQAA
ncbi:PLP-dependent aminotransferase family protein [Kerstersia similis]|uniref:aminotransferase-like domain-containing protein n=1 Tax=Kerstersia similis TaxID=206505 RepID=UPI0039EE934B